MTTCPFILSMDRYGLSRIVRDDDMSIYSIHGQVWTLSNRTLTRFRVPLSMG
jgi:hypothetical protein